MYNDEQYTIKHRMRSKGKILVSKYISAMAASGGGFDLQVDFEGLQAVIQQLSALEEELNDVLQKLNQAETTFTAAVQGGPQPIYLDFSSDARQITTSVQQLCQEEVPQLQSFLNYVMGGGTV